MRGGDAAADGEAEAAAAIRAAARAFDTVEALEELGQRFGRDARSRVLELHYDAFAVAPRSDAHAAARVGVAHRILEQVAEHLAQAVGVAEHRCRGVPG